MRKRSVKTLTAFVLAAFLAVPFSAQANEIPDLSGITVGVGGFQVADSFGEETSEIEKWVLADVDVTNVCHNKSTENGLSIPFPVLEE